MQVQYLASNKNVIDDSNARDSVDDCAEINSLSINAAPETTGVTSFVQEASTCVEANENAVAIGTYVPVNADIQNLTKYFARPVAIANGDLPLGTSGRVFNAAYNNAGNILFNFPNGQARLTGVYGVRATLVFSLQVACTPFHQGVLALSWQYGETDNSITYIRSAHSAMCTNLPHARLDLSTDTMVQLRVPFLHSLEYLPINVSNTGLSGAPYGTVALNSILPTNAVTGMSPPRYQIYLHLEDLEFFGANPLSSSNIVFQSGKKLAPITEEFEKESHPFSSATMALSRSVGWISKGVPMLSSIGGPTSWFLAKAAGAIRAFGFSKPTVVDPMMRMIRNSNILEQNVDVPTAALVVGPFASNTLRVSPRFAATDVDEMSLAYILSNYGQICRFNLDVSNAAGTLMWAALVSPSSMWFRISSALPYCNTIPPSFAPASANGFLPTSMFYYGQMFRFWKGSMKFRFTFGKAKLHGGRVMINYSPFMNNLDDVTYLTGNATAGGSVADYGSSGPNPFGYSAIFNLRDGNVFEFEVPYISPAPYTPFVSNTGVISMHVVDALQASSVISTNIGVLVEVRAGDDFELANVRTALYPPHIGCTPVFQAGRLLSDSKTDVSELTVGEVVTSAKQLISIPKMTPISLAASTKYQFLIPPWFYQPRASVLTPAPSTQLRESFGFGGMVACCYAYVRGGTDFHVYPAQDSSANFFSVVRELPGFNSRGLTNQSPAQQPFSNSPVVINTQGPLHVRLPAYQHLVRYRSSCLNGTLATGSSWAFNGTKSPTIPFDGFGFPSIYVCSIQSANVANGFVSRNAADDAYAGSYMGPPPLLLLAGNPASTIYDLESDYTYY